MRFRIQFELSRAIAFVAVVLLSASIGSGDDAIDFRSEIMPVLTKMGCNAGSCHGAAVGRGGFKLSLYGSQPAADFLAIAREDKGRRINRVAPLRSLVLQKPNGELEHGGNQRFEIDDAAGQLIAKWIQQGAKLDGDRKLVRFDYGQTPLRFESANMTHQFKFLATFTDGTTKDVTQWTVLTSNDESSVEIDSDDNSAHLKRTGRHILLARYLDRVVSIEILVPYYAQPLKTSEHRGENFIDGLVYEKLEHLHIPVGENSQDLTFLRRVSLDLAGRLPTADQVAAFAEETASNKRQRLIDDLLKSPAFTDYWTHRIATQLRIRSQTRDSVGARVYFRWLKDRIAQNSSWKEIAKALLLSDGDSHKNGPANFYRTTGDARLQAEFVSESLLGVKLRCANCHNHPLDHWTQDDYHGLAAVFAKVSQARVVRLNPAGENIHARTGKPAKPRVPGAYFVNGSPDAREPLAAWMLDDQNPYFARSMVNRIWAALMGRGLVDSVDDLRSTNPATHPALLKRLADDFVEHDFDIRHTVRVICNSDTYQRSVGKTGTPNFHRQFYANAMVRQIPAEVLVDSIGDVTGIYESYPGQASQTRAIELFDSKIPSDALDILGRCSREESCESDTQVASGGLSTQLHLLNGALVNRKIMAPGSHLQRLISEKKSLQQIIDFFYLRAYGREPTKRESDLWGNHFGRLDSADPDARTQGLEDLVWSILNSREFTTNH